MTIEPNIFNKAAVLLFILNHRNINQKAAGYKCISSYREAQPETRRVKGIVERAKREKRLYESQWLCMPAIAFSVQGEATENFSYTRSSIWLVSNNFLWTAMARLRPILPAGWVVAHCGDPHKTQIWQKSANGSCKSDSHSACKTQSTWKEGDAKQQQHVKINFRLRKKKRKKKKQGNLSGVWSHTAREVAATFVAVEDSECVWKRMEMFFSSDYLWMTALLRESVCLQHFSGFPHRNPRSCAAAVSLLFFISLLRLFTLEAPSCHALLQANYLRRSEKKMRSRFPSGSDRCLCPSVNSRYPPRPPSTPDSWVCHECRRKWRIFSRPLHSWHQFQ